MAKKGTLFDKDNIQILPRSVFSAIHNDLDPTETLDVFLKKAVDLLYGLIKKKQDTLISGSNIKTINGESIVGNGNITINVDSEILHGAITDVYIDTIDEEVISISLDRNNSPGNSQGSYIDIPSATNSQAGLLSSYNLTKLQKCFQCELLEQDEMEDLSASDCEEGVLYIGLDEVVDTEGAWTFGGTFPIRLT